jgi:hypothetical protein
MAKTGVGIGKMSTRREVTALPPVVTRKENVAVHIANDIAAALRTGFGKVR